MAYAVAESAIVLKGTRHGLLAFVREDADWREVLGEFVSLTTQNSEFLNEARLVFDFGWREVSEEQFDSLLTVLNENELGCNGILSTSLQTRTVAESRGYRAIIGRLGLAQHHGRRLRQEQAAAPAVEPQAIIAPEVATIPPAAEVEPPALSEASIEVEDTSPKTGVAATSQGIASDPDLTASQESTQSQFDSSEPSVANLPAVFDSSEAEGQRIFSSSHEPGIHMPHFEDEEPTLYLRKTLRSGQRVVFAGNVVLLGDLNPGAQIEADGDVIVMGQLRGSVHAGCEGDQQASVITSSLRATQLRIADRFYSADTDSRFFKKSPPTGTLRARLDGETVVVEALPGR